MSPKEIHDDFIKTFGEESPSYSMVKKWAAEFRRRRAWRIIKEATRVKNIEPVHNLIMCDRRSRHDTDRQIGISFGAVESILNNILGISRVSARWVPRRRRAGLIFLSIFCLSMKMTLRNDASN